MTARSIGPGDYSERLVKGHVVGIERLERQRWRVTVDGRRHFTFCSESRARQAGALEAGRLELSASDGCSTGPSSDHPTSEAPESPRGQLMRGPMQERSRRSR